METINVKINISTLTGQKLLKEVQKHPKTAQIEFNEPSFLASERTYTLDECYESSMDILSKNYGLDVRKL